MADLEDAESAITQQETWGLSLMGLAVKRLARAVRINRAAVVQHGNRLDALEARVSALEAPRP